MTFDTCTGCKVTIARGAPCPVCGMPGMLGRAKSIPPAPWLLQPVRREPPPPTSAPPGDWPAPPPAPSRGAGPDVIVVSPLHALLFAAPMAVMTMLVVAYYAGMCTVSAMYFGDGAATGALLVQVARGLRAAVAARRLLHYRTAQAAKLGPGAGPIPGHRHAYSPIPPAGAPTKPDLARIAPPSSPPAAVPAPTSVPSAGRWILT